MNMVEVKTADLIGYALDWAVAKAEGKTVKIIPGPIDGKPYPLDENYDLFSPSTDWSQVGPLIENHRISFEDEDDCFSALLALERPVVSVGSAFGSTHLIAACRAIVAAKLGDTVQVPEELI